MDDFATAILVRILGAIALCFVFLRLVMRGKWVTWNHPVCAGCGHNLTGLPESSTNCPECGGELAKVRKNSVWRRRWMALASAGLLTLICLGILIPLLAVTAAPYANKLPTVVLMPFREYRSVRQMLYQRLMANELSASQRGKLIDEMLKSPDPWSAMMITNLRAGNQLPISDWKKYAAWATEFEIDARATIARGDPLVVRITPPYDRANRMLRMRGTLKVKIDGKEIPAPKMAVDLTPERDRWGDCVPKLELVKIPDELQRQLSDGLHQLEVDVDGESSDSQNPDEVLARRISTHQQPIVLLSKGKESVELVKPENEKMQPGQPEGLKMTVYRSGEECDFDNNIWDWFPKLNQRTYCYKLIAEQNGKHFVLGTFAIGLGDFTWNGDRGGSQLRAGECDVVFEPDREAAKLTVGLTQIMDWPFTVKQVTVLDKRENR